MVRRSCIKQVALACAVNMRGTASGDTELRRWMAYCGEKRNGAAKGCLGSGGVLAAPFVRDDRDFSLSVLKGIC